MHAKSWLASLVRWAGIVSLLWLLNGCGNPSYLTAFISDYQGFHFDEGVWSPDSRRFAAGTYDDTTSNGGNIYVYSADGNLVNILHVDCYDPGLSLLSWLPDGRISCILNKVQPLLGLFTLDQTGHIKTKTMIAAPFHPEAVVLAIQWNPREPWLATIANSQVGSIHIPTLYFSDAAGHQLSAPMLVNADTLAWSHDGKTLALVQINEETGDGDIELLHIEQTSAGTLTVTSTRQLAAGTPYYENVAWSPSDRWLVCRHGSYESEDYLFLLATDGSGKTVKLTSSFDVGQLADPTWSPNGKQLIVKHVDPAGGELVSLNMEQLLAEKHIQP